MRNQNILPLFLLTFLAFSSFLFFFPQVFVPSKSSLLVTKRIPFSLDFVSTELALKHRFGRLASFQAKPSEAAFLKKLRNTRLVEFQKLANMDSHIVLDAVRLYRLVGLRRFQLLGDSLLKSCLEQFQVLEKKERLHIPFRKKLSDRSTLFFAGVLGNYGPLFQQLELSASQRTLLKEQRYWLTVLFLARWSRLLWKEIPLEKVMGKEPFVGYLKARVLWGKTFHIRLEALKTLKRKRKLFPYYRTLRWLHGLYPKEKRIRAINIKQKLLKRKDLIFQSQKKKTKK